MYIPVAERVVNWDRENVIEEPEETLAPIVPPAATKATRRRRVVPPSEPAAVQQAPPRPVSNEDTMPTFIAYRRKGYYREE